MKLIPPRSTLLAYDPWVTDFADTLCAQIDPLEFPDQGLRVSQVAQSDPPGYLFKSNVTRTRAFIQFKRGTCDQLAPRNDPTAELNIMEINISAQADLDPNSPASPRYPELGEKGFFFAKKICENKEQLIELARIVHGFITAPTMYCKRDYPRIKLDQDGVKGFYYGEIISVNKTLISVDLTGQPMQKPTVAYTMVTTNPGRKTQTHTLPEHAFKYGKPRVGYFLVKKDLMSADVVARVRMPVYYDDLTEDLENRRIK